MINSWLVVRFPNGSLSHGGKESDSDYEECEKFRIDASNPKEAVKKAQAKRAYQQRKANK